MGRKAECLDRLPVLAACINIWMISAMPLEFEYSTLEKSSKIRFDSLGSASYVPSTTAFEALVISPENAELRSVRRWAPRCRPL